MIRTHYWKALALAGAFVMSMPLFTQNTQAAYTMENGAYRMEDGTTIDSVIARGIDVSRWQGEIDWNAVAADDVTFVFLRAIYSEGVDPYFLTNVDKASAAGLKVGAYLYSQAVTPEMAISEAEKLLDLLKDHPISYPVVFDAEASALAALSPQEVSTIINAFCKKIEDSGYYPMVYTNDYWLANEIDLSQMHYDVWVARYGAKPVYENPSIWQATQTGTVAGISTNVDINFQYRDFSDKLPANCWRTIGGQTYYYRNYLLQKNTWIDDGTGWFYLGSDAQPQKGWQKVGNDYYYLDKVTGRMASGWLNENENWYYLNPSGAMVTGWNEIDGGRYYMNEAGIRQTGWHTAGDVDYYLNPSDGKVSTGWVQIENLWYYFSENGEKQTGVLNLNGIMYYLDLDTGIMAASTTMNINGSDYAVDANGACTIIVPDVPEVPETVALVGPAQASDTSEVKVQLTGPGGQR